MKKRKVIGLLIMLLVSISLVGCGTDSALSERYDRDTEEEEYDQEDEEDADAKDDKEEEAEDNRVKKKVINETQWIEGQDMANRTIEYVYDEDTWLLQSESYYNQYYELTSWKSYTYETDSEGRVTRKEAYENMMSDGSNYTYGPDINVYEYNSDGKVIRELTDTSANYHVEDLTEYNSDGQIVKVVQNQLSADHSSISMVTTTEYTYEGKKCIKEVKTLEAMGGTNPVVTTTTYTYDKNDLVKKYVISNRGEGEETVYVRSEENGLLVITSTTYAIYNNEKDSAPAYEYIDIYNSDHLLETSIFNYQGQKQSARYIEYDADGYQTTVRSENEEGRITTTSYEYVVVDK